jgi:hypothetical protein
MSAEKLYREVKSGKVKLEQLNDSGKAALKDYMAAKDKADGEQLVKAAGSVAKTVKKIGDKVGGQVKTAFSDAQARGQAVQAQEKIKEAEQAKWDEDNGRNIPVVGRVLRGLDWLSKETKPFADVAQELYTPGGGLTAVNAATKGTGALISRLAPSVGNSSKLLPRVATEAVKEAAVGAPLSVGNALARDPQADHLEEDALLGAVFGGAVGGAVPAVAQGAKTLVRNVKQRGLNQTLDEFIGEMTGPRGDTVHPIDRIVQELQPSPAANKGDELAGNFKRWEGIQQQYNDAVESQFQLLKKQMDERGGVAQGTIIRDPISGEVVDRVGRVSSNPRWYRDFFADKGRKPSVKELRALADEHVKSGYVDDDAGVIPPWKPADIADIDGELASIRGMMDSATDPAERSALQQVAATLEASRGQIRQQLPEGVQGRVVPGAQAKANPPVPPQAAPTPVSGVAQSTQQHQILTPPAPSVPVNPKKTITRTKLVNNIKQNLGITIDTGRTGGGKGVLGVYKVQPEVIRSAAAQDYDTIAHEIGHHLTKKHGLLDPQYEPELINMMNTMGVHPYRQYPRGQWHDEGIAEYMRISLSDPQQARQLAPNFTAFLERQLPKNVQKGLSNVQKDIKTWLDQGEYNQAKGMLDHEGATQGKGASRSKLYTRFFDDLNPIALLEKSLKGAIGIGSKSMYKLARLSRGVGEQAKMAATRGIFDSKGNKLANGLRTIVQPLEKIGMKQDDFATYLAAVHARDLKKLHGKEVPFSDSQMAAVIQKWGGNQAVQKAQKEIVKYNNALMDLLVEAQIYTRESVDALGKKYPNYVPFLRYFDDDAVAGFKNGGYGSGNGFANLMNPVKRMSEEGSTRTIINPLESMVKNTFLVMNSVAKNKVGLQLSDLAKVDGAGAWVEHVPGGKSGKEHIVDVWQKGKKQSYKIRDPELYNAMLSLDHESSNSLIKFLGGAAGILRAGATLTPEFMIRNAFRDVMGAIINSTKYGFNPLDFFKGFFHTVTKSDVFEKFVNSGGAMSTMMSLDRDVSREALETVFKKSLKDKAMNVVTSPAELAKYLSGYKAVKGTVGILRKGAEISELSTKVGAFNKVLKKTGDIEEAAYTARDLMDFNRAGSSVRQANRAVAFLNASLQGSDKMIRSLKDNPASFLTRAFTTLVAPATGIYYWNQNLPDDMKKEYDNIPQWQKDTFFIIGIPGINEFVRIPKPFEAGMLFSTSTERMLRWIQKNDPDAFKGYGRATAESMTPPVMLTALSPLLEAMTNHSFFRDAPVVPRGEQRLEKKDQYGIYTSELSKEIGGFMDSIGMGKTKAASPRIIDNTIKGYTAGLGQYAVDLIDKGIDTVKGGKEVVRPEKKWTEDPFFRSFFVSTAGGGQIREEFYRKWEKLDSAKASADFNEKDLPPDQASAYKEIKSYKKEIDKLSRAYKEVQRSKTLSAKEKRSQLDELDAKMNENARKAVGK